MKLLSAKVIAIYACLLSTQAVAVTLSLEPTSSTAGVGNSLSLELMIAGLGDSTSDSLGGFDMDIAYDTSALTFDGYSLSTYLGDVSQLGALDDSFGEYAAGTVGLTEVSLLSPGELDAIQPASFTLASLCFTVDQLAEGVTTFIAIDSVWALGDGYGNRLSLDGRTGAVITGVQEPGGLTLMYAGLVGLGLFRRKSLRTENSMCQPSRLRDALGSRGTRCRSRLYTEEVFLNRCVYWSSASDLPKELDDMRLHPRKTEEVEA